MTSTKPPNLFYRSLAAGAPQPLREQPVSVERMIHFVPAHIEKIRNKAPQLARQVDVLLGNLEDAIPFDAKDAARTGFIEMGRMVDYWSIGTGLWVRVNALNSPWFLDDVSQIVSEIGNELDVIMLPKVEGSWDIHYIDQFLAQLEARHQIRRPIGVHPVLETAQGVKNVEAIAKASPRVQGISLGPSDLPAARAINNYPFENKDPALQDEPQKPIEFIRSTAQEASLHYTLGKLVDACSGAGIKAFYGPFADIANLETCEQQFRTAYAMGCVGSWSIHPNQIELTKKVFSPDIEEVKSAMRILEVMPNGSGVAMIDGKMHDDAAWKQAKEIYELAILIVQKDPEFADLYGLQEDTLF